MQNLFHTHHIMNNDINFGNVLSLEDFKNGLLKQNKD